MSKINSTEHPRYVYLHLVEKYIGKHIIKVLVGIRRSGKSVLLRQLITHMHKKLKIAQEDMLYIDKEDLSFDFLKNYDDLIDWTLTRSTSFSLMLRN